jgi:hypothetical protein
MFVQYGMEMVKNLRRWTDLVAINESTLYASTGRALSSNSVHRFDIQKMQLTIMACDTFMDIASSIINSRNVFD